MEGPETTVLSHETISWAFLEVVEKLELWQVGLLECGKGDAEDEMEDRLNHSMKADDVFFPAKNKTDIQTIVAVL